MVTATVVIGSGFGDEGKGLITDFEVRRLGADVVARFNGGAQAGHTVTTKDGRRHVFGHVGAGTFAGASTYLSSRFIFNPLILSREIKTLGFNPRIFVDKNAAVTTIYDMALNTLAEISRGAKRHGSCGMGINETVTRHQEFPLFVSDLYDHSVVGMANQLKRIREKWVPARMQALGITQVPSPLADLLNSESYSALAADMLGAAVGTRNIFTEAPSVGATVLEGAQGLMLDEYMGQFPHVTRSITGLPYALIAAKELGLKSIRPTYVTRSYLTRHGAGPLANEGAEFGGRPFDATNVDNQWQGSIRFAPLSITALKKYIEADLQRGTFVAQTLGISIEEPTLAVTCIDQIDRLVRVEDSIFKKMNKEDLPKYIESRIDPKFGLTVSHISRGPTAEDVEYLGK